MDTSERFEINLRLVVSSDHAYIDDIEYFLKKELEGAWMSWHGVDLDRVDFISVSEL